MTELKQQPVRITFLLPMAGTQPVGGFKVVYEYANYLAGKGHLVSIVHPALLRIEHSLLSFGWRSALRTARMYVENKVTGAYKPTSWFDLNSSIRLFWVPSLAEGHIPDGDIVIATAWETAEWVNRCGPSKGKKFYLIQHFETWSGPEERVLATWKMPLEKVVIAEWLESIAEDLGESAHLIYNGFNFERFAVVNAQEKRDSRELMMLYHSVNWKGAAEGLAAYEIARRQEPELRLTLFGVGASPENLPEGATYYRNPPQSLLCELYNRAAIFLAPSWTEGFALPPAEALQCGAAIAVTDIGGFAPYAIHEQTALVSPIKDPEAMAVNILRLVRDPQLRWKLARNGHAKIQEFTWERAGSHLESVLLRSVEVPATEVQPEAELAGEPEKAESAASGAPTSVEVSRR